MTDNDNDSQNESQPSVPKPDPAAPQHIYVHSPPNDDKAVIALILGIVSIVSCGLAGPFAWYMGVQSRNRIRNSNGTLEGESLATAGYICGIIGTVILGFSVLWIFLWFFVVGSSIFFGV